MLIPEVQTLIDSGVLHLFDGEWISRLPAGSQLAAARKCMRPTFNMYQSEKPDRSRVSHGTGRAGRTY